MFNARPTTHAVRLPKGLLVAPLALLLAGIVPDLASAATLDRIKQAAKITLAFEPDARPFSFLDTTGKPAGYSVVLCQRVADAVKQQLGLPDLKIDWVPVAAADRLHALQQGTADLLCGLDPVSLTSRKEADFSISIFPGGVGAVMRTDAPIAVKEVLEQGRPSDRPVWRGSPARTVLDQQIFSVVGGTSAAKWLEGRVAAFDLAAAVAPVKDYAAGIDKIVNGEAGVFFGDYAALLDAARRNAASGNLVVLARRFTYEPIALGMARGEDDLRLLVDGVLSATYRAKDFSDVYRSWFGPPDESVVTFFRQTTLPE
jgi:polar amino acid transport system substrate-binding protein